MNEKTYEYIYQIAEDCDGVYCYIKQGELVRCKDCKKYHISTQWCDCHLTVMREGDFCSYGEKDGES